MTETASVLGELTARATAFARSQCEAAGQEVRLWRTEWHVPGTNTRADIGLVTHDEIWTWELKSAADSLARLQRQGQAYGRASNRCGVIADERWADKVPYLVPKWWAIVIDTGGSLELHRPGGLSPDVELECMLRYLWRAEAQVIAALLNSRRRHYSQGLGPAYRDIELAITGDLDLLQHLVREVIARDHQTRMTYGPNDVTSRLLAIVQRPSGSLGAAEEARECTA